MAFDGRLLAGIGVLTAVVENGSFTRAAEVLGLSTSGTSRALARLEARIGIRLLDRTTRTLRLTDEGECFYRGVMPHLDGIEDAALLASHAAAGVRGRLRIDVDAYFSRLFLMPRLADFMARHPNLDLEVVTHTEMGDRVGDGIDVAVRFGRQHGLSPFVHRLLETHFVAVAAPAYVERHGRPMVPTDLVDHTCIQIHHAGRGRPFEWTFQREEELVSVATTDHLVVHDVDALLSGCLAGVGIARVLALWAREPIKQGLLIDLFPDWTDEAQALHIMHPFRLNSPGKVRAFINFCVDEL